MEVGDMPLLEGQALPTTANALTVPR